MEYSKPIRKSSSSNPPSQKKSSQFAPPPFAVQAQQNSHRPPTQEEIEDKSEAFGLQFKEEPSLLKKTLIHNSQATQTTESQAPVQSNTIQAKSDSLEAAGSNEMVQEQWNDNKFSEHIRFLPDLDTDEKDKTSLDHAKNAMEIGQGLAFIVNTILPYSSINEIPKVVGSILDGLDEKAHSRVAIILGVNAPETDAEKLDHALSEANKIINEFPVPIALVRLTFKGNFPHGAMRNAVMHSKETQKMTEYFTAHHLYPYISIQDFDIGSRRVGNNDKGKPGKHIFHAIDDKLLKLDKLSNFDDKSRIESLPLMIGGGYRVGNQEQLEKDTGERLKKAKIEASPEMIKSKLSDFPKSIKEDMQYRDQYAKISPLLPYTPEPNLFIDANAVRIGSPLTGSKLQFSPNAAEFTELAKGINIHAAEELESYYTERINKPPQPIKNEKAWLDKNTSDLLIHAQNNRHPIRDESIHTDFEHLAIETDLSRLAAGYFKSNRSAPQTHKGLGTVTDRLFSTKLDKRKVSLADDRNSFSKKIKQNELSDFVKTTFEPVKPEEKQALPPHLQSYKSKEPKVHGLGNSLSSAISVPFSKEGLFKGLYYGLPPEQKNHLLFNVATQQYWKEMMHNKLEEQQAHELNFQTNQYTLLDTQVRLRVIQWTKTDGDCGISSLAHLKNENFTRIELVERLLEMNKRQPNDAVQQALNSISGFNFSRWLSDNEVVQVGQVLGLDNIAIVRFNTNDNTWITLQGDPATDPMIIGGVPAVLNGDVNHWVVLQRE